jgi:hypothetical protein
MLFFRGDTSLVPFAHVRAIRVVPFVIGIAISVVDTFRGHNRQFFRN